MAVYQQTYRGYSGPLSSPRLRWWVICRQALSGIVQGRSFGMLLLVCLLPIEIALVLTLARLNVDLPEDLQEYVTNALSIDLAVIAQYLLSLQSKAIYLMLLVAGPALVAPDVANNAMPLFFARGVSRLQYMFGKWSALMLLTAAISWLPNCVLLLLFALGAESGWLAAHLHILGSAVVVPLLWASTCAWLALAVSAWVQSRAMARLVFLAVGLVLAAVGGVISQILGGAIGNLFDLFGAYDSFLAESLGLALEGGAQTSALMVFVVLTGLSIALLVRRLRPVEASK